MTESLIILLFAFVLDLYVGDPQYRLHPVRLIGHLIQIIEDLLNSFKLNTYHGGVALIVSVQVIVLGVYYLLIGFSGIYSIIINIFLVYSCFSLKDLVKHGKAVLVALEQDDLKKARNAVQMLIGRDSKTLDRFGVGRATVESLSENFIDGFLAPLFWFCLGSLVADKVSIPAAMGGVSAILAYKVTNTLDSMVGYKNETYELFGRASAKSDDVLNYLPARLGIPIISLSAQICRMDGGKAWSIGWRDRLKHSSPNAGHAEACVAGALNIRLNGPGIYPHGKVDKPWIGEGTEKVSTDHIKQATLLVMCAAFISTAVLAAMMAFV